MNRDFEIKNNILVKYTGTDKIVQIPEGIEMIEYSCFANNSNIEEVILPSSCKIIEKSAFAKCENLKKIIDGNIEIIEDLAFNCCTNLEKIDLSKCKKIGEFAFCKNSIKTLDLNEVIIGSCAFLESLKLKTLKLNNIKNINYSAFSRCKELTDVEINNVNIISSSCFYKCKNLKEVRLKNIYTIEHSAFAETNIEKIKLPKSLNVTDRFLLNCNNLKTIELETCYAKENIALIRGFNNPNLNKIIGPGIVTENGIVYNKDKTILIAYLEINKNKIYMIPNNVKEITFRAFSYNQFLQKIILNKELETLNEEFLFCMDELKEIQLSNNIKKINEYAFDGIDINNINFTINSTKEEIEQNNILKNFIQKNNIKLTSTKITLEELINAGKNFKEANDIIKEQER